MPRIDFIFPSFAKGLANGLANDTAPIDSLKICTNVDFGQAPVGGITLRPPTGGRGNTIIPLNEFNQKSLSPRWLFRFRGYENDNWPYVLVGKSGALLINANLDEISDIITFDENVRTDSRFATFDENKIFFLGYLNYPAVLEKNGSDLTVKPMGRKATFDLATSAGGALDANTDYFYQVITVDKNGRRSSPYENDDPYIKVSTSSDQTVTISRMSAGGSGDKKYIYRTKGGAAIDDPTEPMVFYYVDVADDEDKSYTDSASDATIATQGLMPDLPNYPPNDLAYATVHNGVMWGFTNQSSVLRYTDQFNYESWPINNQIPIGDPDYLTAVIPVGDSLILFKKNKTYAFWGSNLGNFDYRELSNIYGTRYIDTIKGIGSSGVIFLDSQKRVIMFNGSNFAEISKAIKLPRLAYFRSTLFRDYYILWTYLPKDYDIDGEDLPVTPPTLPVVDWFPHEGFFDDGSPISPDPGDKHGGDEPPEPPPPPGGGGGGAWDPWEDVLAPYDPPSIGPAEPGKGPPIVTPPEGWLPPYSTPTIVAYAYHIPTGAWSIWDGIRMVIPELPDRSVDNFVYFNGLSLEILGKAFADVNMQYPEMVIRTMDADCRVSNQEKSFKEIEIYFEYISDRSFSNANELADVIGQLELMIDGESKPRWQQSITYDTSSPSKRQRFRIPASAGANGTRAALKFIGNQSMARFSLLSGKLWWEPRATPRRNA